MNINAKTLLAAATVAAAVSLSSCSDKKWGAEGTVASADGGSLVLEAPNDRGGWYPVDTVEISPKGSFSLSGEPAGHPEVYRLTYKGQSVYFPIDSLETVTITADASNFAAATIAGSESADKMQKVNDMINAAVKAKGEKGVAYDPDLKRALSETVLRDPSGVVSYYTIFRRVGNTLIFDPADKADLRIIGAVANAYTAMRPNDPRTTYLCGLYLTNRQMTGGMTTIPTDTIVAQEIKLPEIALVDKNGTVRSLTEEASKGKVVVLNFTAYSAQESPAFNLELAKVYDTYKDRGLEIYQVGIDDDEFQWKQSAKNLPWITVYVSHKDGIAPLALYNVQAIPAMFVINRNGELVERVDNINRLGSTVQRYL